jgi:hypothetical protein
LWTTYFHYFITVIFNSFTFVAYSLIQKIMKQFFTTILFALLFVCAKSQVGTTVVISQVYGGGGNGGATYQNDFVELFNPTQVAQSLKNWSVQYASAAGTTWQVAKVSNFTLQPGQYYLLKLSSGGAVGALLPSEDTTGNINLSGTNGKVALSNDTLPITSCLPNAAIVDFVGYGTASCFEGAAAAPTSGGNTSSVLRASSGCQDGNNNGADFAGASVTPRNSSSAFNVCGAATPNIFPQPGILFLTSSVGAPSAVGFYNLAGTTLSPASGTLTAVAGAGLEVSLAINGPFSSSVNVSYTGGTLTATPVYVRISASAPQGVFNSTVTNTGGGAISALVTVNGAVYQNYYNTKADLGLNNLGTWSTAINGTGPSPAAFSNPYQLFNIINQANSHYTGVFDVSNAGNTTRLVVGDGINTITFAVLPGADSVTSATRIDVLNHGILGIQNNRKPFLNTLEVGSTVDFAEAGTSSTDTVRIPTLSYYNLKLTNGIKYLSTGTTTVRGNLIVDAVTSFNGSSTSVSKINLFGNATFLNGAAFDGEQGADAARISIGFNGSSGAQSLNANGIDLKLFRIQRDTTTSPAIITVAANSTMTLGGPTGGGLLLNQSGANTTVLETGNNTINFVLGGFMSSSGTGRLSTGNGTINVLKSLGAGDGGVLRFATGSTLAALIVNLDPAITRDTLTIGDSVTVQSLTLTKGKVVVRASAVLSIALNGVINGASAASFVDGKLRQQQAVNAGTVVLNFPVGKGAKYAPVQIESVNNLVANGFTIQYFNTAYSNLTVNPATLALFPNYYVSRFEYWNILRDAVSTPVKVTLNYTDANSFIFAPYNVRVANFAAGNWTDVGFVSNPANNGTSGKATANVVSTFGPFTFAATATGVIPVKLEYIRGQRSGNSNALNWKVTCLSNSITMEIERAADPRNFKSIGTITASQVRCAQPFDFADARPLQGNNYYRLKMIDIDGKISYSPVVLIINKIKGFEIVGLYPSIVVNQTTLSLSTANATMIETRITDMSGRTVLKQRENIPAGSSLIKMDCSLLAAGHYNLSIVAGDGNVNNIRFVKQ